MAISYGKSITNIFTTVLENGDFVVPIFIKATTIIYDKSNVLQKLYI